SDLRLPGLDGITLVRRMRSRGDRTPVLLMSACGGVEDRVQGLDAGADDYLPKPFAMPELLARIRALTRRPDDPQPLSLRVGDLTLDIVARKATRDGRKIELTNREFELLWLLMRTPGQVCRRSWILEKVWECRFDPRSNIVEVHMSHLRDKVDGGFATPLILSVRGHGYMISDTPVLQGSPTPISQ
ncbi:MAG TPA: DNA-binding response regulator, partial [Verrucomicrobiales bacterium]|nr:DNA-binding response regulator [Verrucomicrobiales bacterium]